MASKQKESESISDRVIIREQGINAKGFGHIAKAIARDPAIPADVLGVYGYLSSMAGSGESSYMRRSRILAELNISKDTYDKAMKSLTEKGYLKREQSRTQGGYYGTTIIEFVLVPEHLRNKIEEAQKNEQYPTMYGGTIYGLGYGTISRLVMRDSRLTVAEKGLYVYNCAIASEKNEVFPSRDQILNELNISKNSYTKYLKKLVDLNYIVPYQKRINGKLAGKYYRINMRPDDLKKENAPCTKIPTTDAPCPKIPTTDVPCTKIPTTADPPCPKLPCTAVPCTVKPTTITNTISSTNTVSLLDRLMDKLREKMHFEILLFVFEAEPQAIEAIYYLVEGMAEVMTTEQSRVQLGREVLFTDTVRKVLMEVSNEAVIHVIERYLARTDTVDNPKAYLLKSIYNEIRCPQPQEEAL